jgi:hypothetical protein
LAIEHSGELCFRQIDGKGDIKMHPTALEDCRSAGREFVRRTEANSRGGGGI